MKQLKIGVMLSLLLIAIAFTSCTKSGTGVTTPLFSNQDSLEVIVLCPTDIMAPYTGEVRVTVKDTSDSTYCFTQMWPQAPSGSTTEYVGYISITANTKSVWVEFTSEHYKKFKVISSEYDLKQNIEL